MAYLDQCLQHQSDDRIGRQMALSGDGNTISVSAANESSNGNSYIQVYRYSPDASYNWTQLGTDILGKNADGNAVTMRLGEDQKLSYNLISKFTKKNNSIRIGITGIPGVGKSSFIEKFGQTFLKEGKSVAVLAIDPSSEKTKGSILGDKSRMETLSADKITFIRPSSNNGALGGVSNKTRESILLCEAAGYDLSLIHI